jgi:hypothetical protein
MWKFFIPWCGESNLKNNNNQYYADKPLGVGVPKDSITG